MKFLARLVVLFYVTLVLFIGCALILFVMQWLNLHQILQFIGFVYYDDNMRMAVGIIGAIILIMNFVFYQIYSINVRRDKIIAFDNPAGRVSVSLSALEDLIKRSLFRMEAVKEVKTEIRASRRGLRIKIRLILKAEANIPQITSKVQELVKLKIQDAIGMEETLDVSIYVGKILPDRIKDKTSEITENLETSKASNIPFHGYRP